MLNTLQHDQAEQEVPKPEEHPSGNQGHDRLTENQCGNQHADQPRRGDSRLISAPNGILIGVTVLLNLENSPPDPPRVLQVGCMDGWTETPTGARSKAYIRAGMNACMPACSINLGRRSLPPPRPDFRSFVVVSCALPPLQHDSVDSARQDKMQVPRRWQMQCPLDIKRIL